MIERIFALSLLLLSCKSSVEKSQDPKKGASQSGTPSGADVSVPGKGSTYIVRVSIAGKQGFEHKLKPVCKSLANATRWSLVESSFSADWDILMGKGVSVTSTSRTEVIPPKSWCELNCGPGWRLPTRKELNAELNTVVVGMPPFDSFYGHETRSLWTATEDSQNSLRAAVYNLETKTWDVTFKSDSKVFLTTVCRQ